MPFSHIILLITGSLQQQIHFHDIIGKKCYRWNEGSLYHFFPIFFFGGWLAGGGGGLGVDSKFTNDVETTHRKVDRLKKVDVHRNNFILSLRPCFPVFGDSKFTNDVELPTEKTTD